MTYIEKNERDKLPTKEEIETEDSRGWRVLSQLESDIDARIKTKMSPIDERRTYRLISQHIKVLKDTIK